MAQNLKYDMVDPFQIPSKLSAITDIFELVLTHVVGLQPFKGSVVQYNNNKPSKIKKKKVCHKVPVIMILFLNQFGRSGYGKMFIIGFITEAVKLRN